MSGNEVNGGVSAPFGEIGLKLWDDGDIEMEVAVEGLKKHSEVKMYVGLDLSAKRDMALISVGGCTITTGGRRLAQAIEFAVQMQGALALACALNRRPESVAELCRLARAVMEGAQWWEGGAK